MATYDEAAEVRSEDALRDLKLFSTVTQEIRGILEQVVVLKEKTPDDWKDTVQELRVDGSFQFLTLKKLNRMAQIRSKNSKDATAEAKQKLDENYLRLQNLQYEISHLDREINNCLQFKSKHEGVDLVEVDEFYKQAPDEIAKRELTTDDEHLRMLARLDWELESRKNLDKELKATHERKEALAEKIKKRKQDLESLRPNLDTVLKSTMPLQEALGDHFTEKKGLDANARFLSGPLYVLFVESKAFSEACDHGTEIQIGGNVDAAVKAKNLEYRAFVDATNLYRNQDDEESDSDNEDERENQSLRRRSTSVSAAAVDNKGKPDATAKRHPLYVSLKVSLDACSENSPCLLLRFYHYRDPDFVSVLPSLELPGKYAGVKNSAVLVAASLLRDLQEIDSVNKSFREVGEGEKPYLWAQRLAGLDATDGDREERYSNMRSVIRLIRHRINARIAVAEQLIKFKSGSIDCDQSITASYAPALSFNLVAWKAIDFSGYCKLAYTKSVLDLGVVSENDFFFLASLQRGTTANAKVAVALSNQYPKKWPLLVVHLQWRGDHTSEEDLDLREIEVEVNCNVPGQIYPRKKLRNALLSYQMYRLLAMLDVYVETGSNCGGEMPSEFPATKLCPRMARGRSRTKPYNYDARYKFQCY